MSSRTRWQLGALLAAVLTSSMASTATAQGQECGSQPGLGGAANYGAPVTEVPLPLMWGQRDEGPFFAMEAVCMRINNILKPQVVAQRGFWDDTGWARGDQTGPVLRVLDGRNSNTEIALLLSDVGTPGQFVGSGIVAMTATSVGDNEKFTPGSRMAIGYRLRNNIVFEASWLNLLATRSSASVGIIPPRNQNIGFDAANSFVSTPFYNYGPSYAGPSRDVISDVLLTPIPPNVGTVSLVNTGSATGAANEIIVDDGFIDDIINFRGTPIAAYGVGNGAELIIAKYRQEWNTGELNMRVPLFQGEVTRTYWLGGFRYAYLQERYRLLISDFSVEGDLFQMRYTNRVKNRYYGMQMGLGSEAYLGAGWALSVQVKGGVLAERSEGETDITNFFDNRFSHSDNQFGVVGMFEGGAYIWWYPVEGIQLRMGYEYMGICGARRSPNPIDYDLGRLRPVYEHKYLSIDGFTIGVGFVF